MNMARRPKPTKDELLSKLVRLADGDTELVNAAIRSVSVDGTANLTLVVKNLVERKKLRTTNA